MNWRRGLIRLWLVGSMLWIVVFGWLTWSYDNAHFFDHIYATVIDQDRSKRAFEAWRDKVADNARPWHETKSRLQANHSLQPPKELAFGDAMADMGSAPSRWWEDADFCTKEFNGLATAAECEELKQVAAAIPILPMPAAAEAWVTRDSNISVAPLLEWAGPVLIPPVAVLLIVVALAWALRGFRRVSAGSGRTAGCNRGKGWSWDEAAP